MDIEKDSLESIEPSKKPCYKRRALIIIISVALAILLLGILGYVAWTKHPLKTTTNPTNLEKNKPVTTTWPVPFESVTILDVGDAEFYDNRLYVLQHLESKPITIEDSMINTPYFSFDALKLNYIGKDRKLHHQCYKWDRNLTHHAFENTTNGTKEIDFLASSANGKTFVFFSKKYPNTISLWNIEGNEPHERKACEWEFEKSYDIKALCLSEHAEYFAFETTDSKIQLYKLDENFENDLEDLGTFNGQAPCLAYSTLVWIAEKTIDSKKVYELQAVRLLVDPKKIITVSLPDDLTLSQVNIKDIYVGILDETFITKIPIKLICCYKVKTTLKIIIYVLPNASETFNLVKTWQYDLGPSFSGNITLIPAFYGKFLAISIENLGILYANEYALLLLNSFEKPENDSTMHGYCTPDAKIVIFEHRKRANNSSTFAFYKFEDEPAHTASYIEPKASLLDVTKNLNAIIYNHPQCISSTNAFHTIPDYNLSLDGMFITYINHEQYITRASVETGALQRIGHIPGISKLRLSPYRVESFVMSADEHCVLYKVSEKYKLSHDVFLLRDKKTVLQRGWQLFKKATDKSFLNFKDKHRSIIKLPDEKDSIKGTDLTISPNGTNYCIIGDGVFKLYRRKIRKPLKRITRKSIAELKKGFYPYLSDTKLIYLKATPKDKTRHLDLVYEDLIPAKLVAYRKPPLNFCIRFANPINIVSKTLSLAISEDSKVVALCFATEKTSVYILLFDLPTSNMIGRWRYTCDGKDISIVDQKCMFDDTGNLVLPITNHGVIFANHKRANIVGLELSQKVGEVKFKVSKSGKHLSTCVAKDDGKLSFTVYDLDETQLDDSKM